MEISRYDHLVTYDGLPTLGKLNMLTLERGLPIELHTFINNIKQQYTHDEINAKCRPFFAHEYALSRLKAEGFKMAVCSNSVMKTVTMMMDKSSLSQYFDTLISNQDVTKSKPDPEMYLRCMAKLGVTPQETLILEDNDHGIKAALASGAYLMKIETINDVNYFDIKQRIRNIEEGSA
jgi:HAD superfamily hydrolase (TIGR01509 family)